MGVDKKRSVITQSLLFRRICVVLRQPFGFFRLFFNENIDFDYGSHPLARMLAS